jgi:3D (Asp-Asp-Asp) domain-containing protein
MPRETRVAGRGGRLRRFLVHGAVLALLGGASAVCGRPADSGSGACSGARITAYSLRGVTASGGYTAPGVAAVDRRLIPLGSIVHVDGLGSYLAADTGGGVAGCAVDLYVPSYAEAMQFGVQYRDVWW